MMPFRILSWTGKVEEHFPRQVQGLELRKNSRRTPEKLIEVPTEAKEPQKRHVQGSDGKTGKKGGWSVSDELGGGSASLESGSRTLTRRRVSCSRRPEKARVDGAWMGFWFRCFGTNWRSPPGAPCGVEKTVAGKFAGKVRRKSCRR